MMAYVLVGTNDLSRAVSFYEALFDGLDAKRVWESDRGIAWSNSPSAPGLGVILPFNEEPATVGNGSMVALHMPSREWVDKLHAKALALGGTDEGAPGERGPGFYAGYFRDLDGNKLNAVCFG
ncbi:VOC family protein [Burkholderiaceae bacterium DAT-1]|nr:VOC family protein [Burkholderiaceae bacterium DAT-1]